MKGRLGMGKKEGKIGKAFTERGPSAITNIQILTWKPVFFSLKKIGERFPLIYKKDINSSVILG